MLGSFVDTPVLVLDLQQVKDNYNMLKKLMPNLKIFYAVKANSHPAVLSLLNTLGSNFDVQSKNEIDLCLSMGIDGSRLSFGNTIKTEKNIQYAKVVGVNYFVQDDISEIEKISKYAPNSNVYLRLDIGQTTALWPLSGKFGIPANEMIILLKKIVEKQITNINIVGVSFHVGSQCEDYSMWIKALKMVKEVFDAAEFLGFNLNTINLGGGLPTEYNMKINVPHMLKEISEFILATFNPQTQIFMEPGRFMVGDAGILVSKVILKSKRNNENWIYIDAGIYQGLMEQSQSINYTLKYDEYVESPRSTRVMLAGPTCDSYDIIYKNIEVPSGIKPGDKIYFLNAGQYTTGYNTGFNGLDGPKTIIINAE